VRWALAASFLAGLAIADHYQGVYLLVPLVWVLCRLGGRRARAAALFLAVLAPAARILYAPIRAHAGFPASWGVADRLPSLLAYLGFSDYSHLFFGRAPGNPLEFALAQAGLLANAFGVTCREAGLVLLLAAPGVWVLWRAAPWAAQGALIMAGLNLLLASSYNASQMAKFELPLLLVAAVFAGAGLGWLAARWRAAPAVAALVAAVSLVRGSPSAMRDRDFMAFDHARNLMLAAPSGSWVVGFNEPWLFLPWYASAVEPGAGLRVMWSGYLAYDAPERRLLERSLGARADRLRWCQEGSALLWRMAEAASPAGVFCEYVGVPAPSQGVRWRGLLLEVTEPGDGTAFDETSWRVVRALRLRSFRRPAGPWAEQMAGWVAEGLGAQAREALEAGEAGRAGRLLAAARGVKPDLPELRELAAKLAGKGGVEGRSGRKEAALALDQAGVRFLEEMKPLRAARSWRDARRLDPACASACRHLGALAFFEERFGDAVRWDGTALALDPADSEARAALGRVRDALAWNARLPGFERALDRGEAGPDALCDAGNAFWNTGRVKVAEACYRRAVRIDARSARAWNNLGSALAEQGRTREAVRSYERAVAADPRRTDAMLNLAAVLARSGDPRGAASWANRVLALEPGNRRARELALAAKRAGT
jgi:tetratricopeptide (TPR) repeat protein